MIFQTHLSLGKCKFNVQVIFFLTYLSVRQGQVSKYFKPCTWFTNHLPFIWVWWDIMTHWNFHGVRSDLHTCNLTRYMFCLAGKHTRHKDSMKLVEQMCGSWAELPGIPCITVVWLILPQAICIVLVCGMYTTTGWLSVIQCLTLVSKFQVTLSRMESQIWTNFTI